MPPKNRSGTTHSERRPREESVKLLPLLTGAGQCRGNTQFQRAMPIEQ